MLIIELKILINQIENIYTIKYILMFVYIYLYKNIIRKIYSSVCQFVVSSCN